MIAETLLFCELWELLSKPTVHSSLSVDSMSSKHTVLREEQGVLSRLFFIMPVQSSKSMYTGPIYTEHKRKKKDDNQLKRFLNL